MKKPSSSGLKSLLAFYSDTRGVTALEYGLIAAVIAGTVAVAITAYGGRLAAAFTSIAV